MYSVQWPGNRLPARIAKIRELAQGKSGPVFRAKLEIRNIVEADNEDKLMRSVDRYGKPLAPLAPSTLKRRKPGQNPNPLIPHGFASRFIQCLESLWEGENGDTLVVRWNGPKWIAYHLTGATKKGTKWVLPRRDVSGITPKGWAQIRALWKRIAGEVLKAK